ncbi:hypothetical protein KU43P_17600 [Pseudomonas sp. KU43P]|nr:hypothetical protein KU43P_17600 [Pseudomonas sp. KU43P]
MVHPTGNSTPGLTESVSAQGGAPHGTRVTTSANSISKPLVFTVKRQASETFGPPKVLEAQPDGSLRPYDARNGATVEVTYDSMNASDRIDVRVIGHNAAASYQSDPENGDGSGTKQFTVPAHVIGANQGKEPEVLYAVSRGEETPKLSLPLMLKVGTLSNTRLPVPGVPQAEDGTSGPEQLQRRRRSANRALAVDWRRSAVLDQAQWYAGKRGGA